MNTKRYRLYSALLALGASFLLARTVVMLSQGALMVFVPWASVLLLAELTLDAAALAGALRWWATGTGRNERLSLRLAVAVTLLHAVRVLVFVMGRTGPWVDFDVRPAQRAMHDERRSWPDVYLTGILSAASIVAVVVIWRLRKRGQSAPPRQ